LATGLRLAHRGHKVTILEKTDVVGGRNRTITVNDCTFDAGPTLLMMLDPFFQLFRDVGERLENHLEISLCDPNYRVFFADDSRIDCTSNMAKMVRNIERLSGPDDASRYPPLLGRLADLYRVSLPAFVRKNYDSPFDLIRPSSARMALRHGMLGNLAKGMERVFTDPKLHMLFCLQTMYLGLSPFQAPWVYAVLAYMEYGEGIWYPKGGMVEITDAVARLATARGAEIRLNSPVVAIEGRRVRLQSGQTLEASAVICNADLPFAERSLLPQTNKLPSRRYSCSAYNLYLDYKGELPEVLHHNIFLGRDFKANLDQIFRNHQVPEDPAFYLAVSSKTDASKAPQGHSNIQILIPSPNLDHAWSEEDGARLEKVVFERLAAETSFDPGRVCAIKRIVPRDWLSMLNLDRGAAFGLSHELLQTACFRASNKSKSSPGTYFVGASTVPGNGLPMVLISAELVEQRLLLDGLI
jgi:phytoene desaturase